MSDRPAFSVADDPVLPVLYAQGDSEVIGIKTALLDAPGITDLANLSPPGYAMWRHLLTVFAYRVTGLDDLSLDLSEWRDRRDAVWNRGSFDGELVEGYFEEYADRWNLFDEKRPWLQVASLREEAERKSIAELLPDRPSGVNMGTLFSPFHDGVTRAVEPWVAVEAMLRVYGYAGSGRMGSRTLPGAKSNASGFGAPLRARVSHLPVAETLFHSLVASLVPPRKSLLLADGATTADDRAEWEADPADPAGARPAARGVISVLAHQAQHAVLLDPEMSDEDDVLVGGCWRTWRYARRLEDETEAHPFLAYRDETDKQKSRRVPRYSMLDANPRDAWRDVSALVPVPGADHRWNVPDVMAELSTLDGGRATGTMRIAVAAWHQHPGQQRDGDWNLSVTPDVHVALWSTESGEGEDPEQWRRGIDAWVRTAEAEWGELARSLRQARIRGLGLNRNDKTAGLWARQAENEYWAQAHRCFTVALEDPDMTPGSFEQMATGSAADRTSALGQLHRVVEALYDEVTVPHVTARAAEAIVRNRPRLASHVAQEVTP